MRLIPVVVVKRAQGGSSLRVRRFRWRRRINRRRLRLCHFASRGRRHSLTGYTEYVSKYA